MVSAVVVVVAQIQDLFLSVIQIEDRIDTEDKTYMHTPTMM